MKLIASGRIPAFALLLGLFGAYAAAQKIELSEESYILPPKELADLVTAPRHLNVTLNNLGPDGESFLITRSEGMPSLQQYAKPYVNLGETAFDYRANRARQFQIRRDSALELFNYKTGTKLEIAAPKGSWLSSPAWSPDGSRVA